MKGKDEKNEEDFSKDFPLINFDENFFYSKEKEMEKIEEMNDLNFYEELFDISSFFVETENYYKTEEETIYKDLNEEFDMKQFSGLSEPENKEYEMIKDEKKKEEEEEKLKREYEEKKKEYEEKIKLITNEYEEKTKKENIVNNKEKIKKNEKKEENIKEKNEENIKEKNEEENIKEKNITIKEKILTKEEELEEKKKIMEKILNKITKETENIKKIEKPKKTKTKTFFENNKFNTKKLTNKTLDNSFQKILNKNESDKILNKNESEKIKNLDFNCILTESEINLINNIVPPKYKIHNPINDKDSFIFQSNSLDNQCVICINDIVKGDQVRVLNCVHMFHKKCIDQWLLMQPKKTCPLCRKNYN
jgi:hypothetical protein